MTLKISKRVPNLDLTAVEPGYVLVFETTWGMMYPVLIGEKKDGMYSVISLSTFEVAEFSPKEFHKSSKEKFEEAFNNVFKVEVGERLELKAIIWPGDYEINIEY